MAIPSEMPKTRSIKVTRPKVEEMNFWMERAQGTRAQIEIMMMLTNPQSLVVCLNDILTSKVDVCYITYESLAGEESSLAPLPFPNLGASTASALFSRGKERFCFSCVNLTILRFD